MLFFFIEMIKGNLKVESESWNIGRGSEWERCNKQLKCIGFYVFLGRIDR